MNRKQQAAASRSALVEAARECFTESGYDDTSVAEILGRAGMARGALYHYFPGGKAEIFTAVFESINDAFHVRRDALQALPSPVARLRGGISVFVEMCTEDDFARIALADAPNVVPGQGERGSSYALLREQVAEAVVAGEFLPLDVDAVAITLYGAVRAAGEFVIGIADRASAVPLALATLDRLIAGLETDLGSVDALAPLEELPPIEGPG